MATEKENIIKYAKCMAIDPPIPYPRGWKTERVGRMPCGTYVKASYYNWNESSDVLSRLRVYSKASENDGWHFVEGFMIKQGS